MNELTISDIQNKIVNIPNRPPVMLAKDLAELYESKTERINEAVRRNPDRFPEDFCFRLTKQEAEILTSQNVMFKQNHVFTHQPWAFTRMGANMLSAVLKSPVAAARSVQIMRAFSKIEEYAEEARDTNRTDCPVMPKDSMMITKDKYIDLLEFKVKTLEEKTWKRVYRLLTEEEKTRILSMTAAGISATEIGRRISRAKTTVRSFLDRHRKAVH